VENFDVWP